MGERYARGKAGPGDSGDPVVRFARLYRGRRDCQGTEDGGCLWKRVTLGHYRGHLQGRFGLGIYPLRDDGTVGWGAGDLDRVDADRALPLWRLLHDAGLPAVLLRSRQKGFHVTVFVRGWVRASDIRRVLRVLVVKAGLPPETEIFPKADQLATDSKAPGGYLRLPYPAALPDPGRSPRVKPDPGKRTALDPHSLQPLSLEGFLDLAEGSLVDPDRVRALAEEFAAEEGAAPPRSEFPEVPDDPAELGVSQEIATLIREGRTVGRRSESQLAVACALFNAGHSEVVVRAVLTCPKYRISERALERSPVRCEDALDRCLTKARARVTAFPAAAAGSLSPTLHRRLLALKVPHLAWPVLAEILATTDRATGLSLVTASSLARKFRVSRATVYRRALEPLRCAGIVKAVRLDTRGGQWSRTAFRVVVGPVTSFGDEKPSEDLQDHQGASSARALSVRIEKCRSRETRRAVTS